MTTYKISGKKRRELKETLRRLRYQQERWGHSEVRAARIKDIERALEEKITSGELQVDDLLYCKTK